MDNLAIFQTVASVLGQRRAAALVTVVSTTGSTPGKVGYKMLVFDGGRQIAGTVGGGLTEAHMIEEAARMLGAPGSRLFRVDLAGTPDEEKGICGGSVEFLIESFDETARPLFEELSAGTASDETSLLVSIVAPDGLPRKRHVKNIEQIGGPNTGFSQEIAAAIRQAASSPDFALRMSAGPTEVFIEKVTLQPALILFGAGHVSCHIARFARWAHFRVIVCDDRAEYANRERFPDADEVLVEDFARVFDRRRIDARAYIVIVTRGHREDRAVLERAIKTGARYIGMIGSKRKTLTLLETLRNDGVAQELLERVYAPIGLSIGAVTAEEIALSIVGELVKIRRLGDEPPVGHLTLARRGGAS